MAHWNGFTAVDDSGSEFGFRCGGHDVLNDLGNGEDGAVVGRVGVIARHEEMPTGPAAGFGLREVGGIAVADKNHISCSIRDDGVGVRRGVAEKKFHLLECALRGRCLLRGDGAEGGKNGEINRTGIVEESANDFLDKFLVGLIEKGGVVLVGRVLFGGAILRLDVKVGLVLRLSRRLVSEMRDGGLYIVKHREMHNTVVIVPIQI